MAQCGDDVVVHCSCRNSGRLIETQTRSERALDTNRALDTKKELEHFAVLPTASAVGNVYAVANCRAKQRTSDNYR